MADGQPRYASFGYRRESTMTAVEWMTSQDPLAMLRHLGPQASPRTLRLFGTACYRHIWDDLDKKVRSAVELAEYFSDGFASRMALTSAEESMQEAGGESGCASDYAFTAAQNSVGEMIRIATVARMHAAGRIQSLAREKTARSYACSALRDIFTPFRANREWVALSAAVALAQGAYDERLLPSGHLDPGRLAVLADAVEESGGADEELVQHLRSPGPHVRGCWAVDLIVGKQ
jgi:hypothetical protein